MTLEEEVTRLKGSPARNRKNGKLNLPSPKNAKPTIVHGAVTDLENKLIDLTKENKELQKEIRLLKRIQDR